MKALIYITLVCTALAGCTTTKKMSKSIVEQKHVSVSDSSQFASFSVNSVCVTEQAVIEVLSLSENALKITEYDTSLPIDASTGKPPIKREVESSRVSSQKNSENKAITTTKDDTNEVEITTITRVEVDENIAVDENYELERKINVRIYLAIATILISAIICVVMAIKKRGKRCW